MSKQKNFVLLGLFISSLSLASQVFAQHKGISFQAVLQDPEGHYPTASGLTVTLQILDPVNNCVLREEEHSGVNISNGYMNLVVGGSSSTISVPSDSNPNPILPLAQVMDNSKVINGFNCTYNPQGHHGRKLRLSVYIPRNSRGPEKVTADFNIRAVAFAVNSETLNGKSQNDFVNTNDNKNVTQENVESVFERFTKLDGILNASNNAGNTLGVNITGTAASATIAANVTGIVGLANGGTGATTASDARANLGLGPLATLSTSGTPNGSKFLRDDGVWSAVAGGVASVAGKTGVVTLQAADISDFDNAADARILAQKGNLNGLASLNSSGKVPSSQLSLLASDIPNLSAAQITSGTISRDVSSANVTGTNLRIYDGTSEYLTFKLPNGGTGYTLNWPKTAGAANEFLRTDASGNLSWATIPSASVTSVAGKTGAVTLANTDISGLGTSATLNVASSGNASVAEVVKGNDTRLTDSRAPSGAANGDLSGTYPNPAVARINGVQVATAVAGDDQKFLKYVDGSGWLPHYVKLSELKNSTGGSVFNLVGCTQSQTMAWSSLTDQFSCQDISIPATKVTGLAGVATSGDYSSLSNKPPLGGLASLNSLNSSLVTGLTANRILGVNGAGTMTSVTCAQGQILGFDSSGVYGCYNPHDYSMFSLGGNSVGGTAVFGTKSNHNLSFITNDTEKMILQNDGKLGIGKAPSYLLDINGTANATELRIGGHVLGDGLQNSLRTVASIGDSCSTVGVMAKSSDGDLLVCDEATSVIAGTSCAAIGVGAMTLDSTGGLYVCGNE
ncbi:hypothetical protein [Bdellovibrio sp.]|uniref:hypothetical protein n=1 Tax=Bdellovibrio sp. TaxID=28201 RepID=UPI0039E2964C